MVEPAHRNLSPRSLRPLLATIAGALLAGACATGATGGGGPAPTALALTGMEWRLDHFQSSDDSIGTIRPAEGEVWTLLLNPDGSIAMGLFCNRGTGGWTSPDAQRERGELTITPGASTMAACPPSRLERLPADLAKVRSFVIADGKLHLNLMMDGGNYVWVPQR